jgi:GDP-L-fucose synthase
MRVLITGAYGMVGTSIREHRTNYGHTLICPDRDDLDLLNGRDVEHYFRGAQPDVVVHCAGKVGGIKANIKEPYRFLYENMTMGMNVVTATFNMKDTKLINLGSSCMYPKDLEVPLKPEHIGTGVLEPTNEGYALAKIATAKLCQAASNSHLKFKHRFKTLVPCNLYGERDKFDEDNAHLLPAAVRKIHDAKHKNEPVTIWGSGQARREFMYVDDLSQVIWDIIDQDLFDRVPDIMNVGAGTDHTVLEYYEEVYKVVHNTSSVPPGAFLFDLSKPEGMRRKLVDTTVQNGLGWLPQVTLQEGIRKLVKEYEFIYCVPCQLENL